MKEKKIYCPQKHENHYEFYKNHPEYRTEYWNNYFNNISAKGGK